MSITVIESPATVVTAPYAEPMDVEEAKRHLRIDIPDEDEDIRALIQSARLYAENFTRRQLVVGTFRKKYDLFPSSDELDLATPLVSVTGITYVDSAGSTQSLATTVYEVDADAYPGLVRLDYNQSWPSLRGDRQGVVITYIAGHLTPFTVATATDLLTVKGRTFANADIIRLSNSGGELPGGLSVNTDYHVRDVSGSTFKLAATAGGAAIDITSTGSGTHYIGEIPAGIRHAMKMLIGHWHENRETVLTGTISKDIEFSVNSLLWADRIKPL